VTQLTRVRPIPMPRLIICLALFAAAACAFAQRPSLHVTFKVRASRTEQVLPQLAAATKLDLRAGPGMENDVLVIDVKDVPLDAVMARIATVTVGVWRQQGSVYRLMPDLTKRNQQELAEASLRTAAVRKALQNLHADLKKVASSDSKEKQDVLDVAAEKLNVLETDAVSGLLDRLDPSVLAEEQVEDRLVFSTSPTRFQLPMGAGADEILDHLISAHNKIIEGIPKEALAAVARTDIKGEADVRDRDAASFTEIGPVAKALLIITRSYENFGRDIYGDSAAEGGEVQLRLFDSSGKVIFATREVLTELGVDSMLDDIAKVDAGATPQAEPIEYSVDSTAFRVFLASKAAWHFNPPLPPDLRKKLVRPDLYDPLSYFQSDQMFAYAKSQGKPLVANLPDLLGSQLDGPHALPTSMADVAAFFESSGPLVKASDDAFVTVSPAFPAESRARRMDRSALAALIKASQEKLAPSLDDLAEYSEHAPNPLRSYLEGIYLIWFIPGWLTDPEEPNLWRMLQLYGAFTPNSRSVLAATGRLSFDAVSASERSALERIVYGNGTEFVPENSSSQQTATPLAFPAKSEVLDETDYRSEPTELAPNGLPDKGYIQLQRSDEPAAFGIGSGYDALSFGPVYHPRQLMMMDRLRKRGSKWLAGTNPSASALQLGASASLDFTLHLKSKVAIRQTLKDDRFPRDAEILSEKDLLTKWQPEIALIMAELERIREQNQKAGTPIHP